MINTRLAALIRKEFIQILRDPLYIGFDLDHSDYAVVSVGLCCYKRCPQCIDGRF